MKTLRFAGGTGGAPPPPPPPPAEPLGTPVAAYSLRRLLSSYSGPAVRVRRQSSGAEADIGFASDGSLSRADLAAHCGTSTGTVAAWYDQTGGGRHLLQPTVTAQPSIFTSSSPSTFSTGQSSMNKPFNGRFLQTAASFSLTSCEIFLVVEYASAITGSSAAIVNFLDPVLSQEAQVGLTTGGVARAGLVGGAWVAVGASGSCPPGSPHVISASFDASTVRLWVDGVESASGSAAAVLSGILQVFNGNLTPAPVSWADLLVYSTLQTDARSAITSNIKAFYGIP